MPSLSTVCKFWRTLFEVFIAALTFFRLGPRQRSTRSNRYRELGSDPLDFVHHALSAQVAFFARDYVAKCEEKYGYEAVERILDAGHALKDHGVNRYARRARPNLGEERRRIAERQAINR